MRATRESEGVRHSVSVTDRHGGDGSVNNTATTVAFTKREYNIAMLQPQHHHRPVASFGIFFPNAQEDLFYQANFENNNKN